MAKPFTEQERRVLRERLIESGYKHFTQFGVKKTSIEELAAAVGISKGAFYLFYENKEALLFDVLERTEIRYREEVLASITVGGEMPEVRLAIIFKMAFTRWKQYPILQLFAKSSATDAILRSTANNRLESHVGSDQRFATELIATCHAVDIPITASAEQLTGLFYAIIFATMHEENYGPDGFEETLNLLIGLLVAFSLGKVDIPVANTPPR